MDETVIIIPSHPISLLHYVEVQLSLENKEGKIIQNKVVTEKCENIVLGVWLM